MPTMKLYGMSGWDSLKPLKPTSGLSSPAQQLHDGQPEILVCVQSRALQAIRLLCDTECEIVHLTGIDEVVTLHT